MDNEFFFSADNMYELAHIDKHLNYLKYMLEHCLYIYHLQVQQKNLNHFKDLPNYNTQEYQLR